MDTLRIATRKSPLALWQSEHVAARLRAAHPGLEVVLVNSPHAQRPDQADLLAQTNLDGGGTNDKHKANLATPLAPQEQSRLGDGLVEAQRRSEQAQAPQMQAMTAKRGKTAIAVDTQQVTPSEAPRQVSG